MKYAISKELAIEYVEKFARLAGRIIDDIQAEELDDTIDCAPLEDLREEWFELLDNTREDNG